MVELHYHYLLPFLVQVCEEGDQRDEGGRKESRARLPFEPLPSTTTCILSPYRATARLILLVSPSTCSDTLPHSQFGLLFCSRALSMAHQLTRLDNTPANARKVAEVLVDAFSDGEASRSRLRLRQFAKQPSRPFPACAESRSCHQRFSR